LCRVVSWHGPRAGAFQPTALLNIGPHPAAFASLRSASAATLPLRGRDWSKWMESSSPRVQRLRDAVFADACALLLSLPRRGWVASRSEAGWGSEMNDAVRFTLFRRLRRSPGGPSGASRRAAPSGRNSTALCMYYLIDSRSGAALGLPARTKTMGGRSGRSDGAVSIHGQGFSQRGRDRPVELRAHPGLFRHDPVPGVRRRSCVVEDRCLGQRRRPARYERRGVGCVDRIGIHSRFNNSGGTRC
jgi:hypothetical protein